MQNPIKIFLLIICCSLLPQAEGTWSLSRRPCAVEVGAKPTFAQRISTLHTIRDPVVDTSTMLPRGSAILTQSGDLQKQGIVGIVHAASGAMTRQDPPFQPTLESVGAVVQNSMALAQVNGFQRIAIPFIGGSSFASRIGVSLQVLAERLIKSAMEMKNGVEVVFVTFGDHDTQLVKDASQRLQSPFVVRNGSITQFALHQCPLIVNAANMEGVIGGGVAFAIGSGSGNISALDREALEIRAAFYGIDVRKAHNYSSNLQAAFQIGAFMKRFLSL